jgi:hypothetical protein
LDQEGCGVNWLVYGYVLKVELAEFADELGMGYERKKETE